MATQGKQVKTLSKAEQQKTIKGAQKPKRNVVKNTLESPFALDWPVISTEHKGEIKVLLQKTCSGLKTLGCKPPWNEVRKFKGADRTAFLKEYRKKFLDSLDSAVVNQNRENEELLSHLIFGYNSVMRALEKDCLAGVLVKKNVEPPFLVKAFLPGCANKCIPLIPLDDLDSLLKDEETLALPHACMVLGLKPTVKDDNNRFYALFTKMCEAVDMEEGVDEGFEEVECSTAVTVTEDNKENKACTSNYSLTHEQVQSYHLKRSCKNKRAFIPGERKEKNVDAMECGAGFISLEPTKVDAFVQEEKMQLDSKPAKLSKKKSKQLQKKGAASSSLTSMDLNNIFIDVGGDMDQSNQKDEKQESSSLDARNVYNMENGQGKKRRKTKPHNFPYVSAKTKRVKNNPNRKNNKSGKKKKE